jgi:hypothetical protein
VIRCYERVKIRTSVAVGGICLSLFRVIAGAEVPGFTSQGKELKKRNRKKKTACSETVHSAESLLACKCGDVKTYMVCLVLSNPPSPTKCHSVTSRVCGNELARLRVFAGKMRVKPILKCISDVRPRSSLFLLFPPSPPLHTHVAHNRFFWHVMSLYVLAMQAFCYQGSDREDGGFRSFLR